MKKIGIYPGTFDPITKGHIDIIERSFKVFDKLIVAVAKNEKKHPVFTMQERVQMIEELYGDNERVEIVSFNGLLVDLAREKGVDVVIRGLRAVSDFEYEMQIALTNRVLEKEFETIFMMPSLKFIYLNASVVRELATMKADLSPFVTKNVEKRLIEKFGEK